MIRRGLVLAAAVLTAVSVGGCHEILCGGLPPDGEWSFELVDGVYRCKAVEKKEPYANWTQSPDAVIAGREVRLDASGSVGASGGVVRWDWELDGDFKFDDAHGKVLTHTFRDPGKQKIGLRITDSGGKHGRTESEIDVLDPRTATNPVPVIEADTTCVRPGGTVTFDNSRSYDDKRIAWYTWEFPAGDRDDAPTSSAPGTIHVTYPDEGTHTARLIVIDDDELRGEAEQEIVVGDGLCASFAISPNPAVPYQQVRFDASGSTGDIARYEWDLDGREGYERTTTSPVITTNYTGERRPSSNITIGLRVSNEPGSQSATTTRLLRFEAVETPGSPESPTVPPGARPSSAKPAAGTPFTARLRGDTYGRHRGSRKLSRRTAGVTGRALIGKLRGRLLGRRAAASPFAKYLRAVWLGRVSMRAVRRTGRLSLTALAYARFERAPGGACVRLRLSARGRRRTGTLATQGGNGDGRRLALTARFRWRSARGGGLVLRGRLAARTKEMRPPTEDCLEVRDLRP